MKMLSSFTQDERKRIRYIISDVDDTITTDGALYPDALSALYRIRDCGKKTILVTGGSAGWSDAYIRQWPVDAVIAESGALLIYKDSNGIRYVENPVIEHDAYMRKKDALIAGTRDYVLSSDQYARIYDVAYEKRGLDLSAKKKLFSLIDASGAMALASSIHINVLFAPLSKKNGLEAFFPLLKDVLGIDEDLEGFYSSSLALGDSLNDEPLFEAAATSVGNKRVLDNSESFSHKPTYVTDKYGSESFSYTIGRLLD